MSSGRRLVVGRAGPVLAVAEELGARDDAFALEVGFVADDDDGRGGVTADPADFLVETRYFVEACGGRGGSGGVGLCLCLCGMLGGWRGRERGRGEADCCGL